MHSYYTYTTFLVRPSPLYKTTVVVVTTVRQQDLAYYLRYKLYVISLHASSSTYYGEYENRARTVIRSFVHGLNKLCKPWFMFFNTQHTTSWDFVYESHSWFWRVSISSTSHKLLHVKRNFWSAISRTYIKSPCAN